MHSYHRVQILEDANIDMSMELHELGDQDLNFDMEMYDTNTSLSLLIYIK